MVITMKKLFYFINKLDDKGMTLTELIISSILIIFVLVAAYNLSTLVNQSYSSTKERSDIVYNTSTAFFTMDKYISQNLSMETFQSYNLTILTDTRADSTIERIYFTYNSTKKTLDYKIYNTNTLRQNTTIKHTGTLAENVYNSSYGRPIFKYYDAQGVQITNTEKIQSDTRKIEITLLLRQPKETEYYTNTKTIYFRNRGL